MVGNWKRCLSLCVMSALISSIFLGCYGSSLPAGNNPNSTPIKLTIGSSRDIDSRLAALIQAKFPNITLNVVKYGKGSQLSDLVAKNEVPDILEEDSLTYIKIWSNLGLTYDFTPLIQKYKTDLSRYEPAFIENLHRDAPNNGLYALPYIRYLDVLYYNKDIFDKFGVPYPKDGMTWPDIIELAKKVTGSDGNTQYLGFDPRYYPTLSNEYPLPFVDPQTDQAVVTNDQWSKFMEFYKSIYQIPGNLPQNPKDIGGQNEFITNKNLAMWIIGVSHWNDLFAPATANGLNWDMVSLPTFPDAPGQHSTVNGRALGISSSSPHKEQAFQVIAYMGSVDVQDELAKEGNIPVVTNASLLQDYGNDVAILKGKNLKALDVHKFAVQPKQVSPYDALGRDILGTYIPDIVNGKQDVNTELHLAADAINQAIVKAKQSQ